VHNDDISSVLILNKKSITNHESQLFQSELEKFRAHQNRLLQASHKQSSLLKELTSVYGELLQDKRVRSDQTKYETITKQRNAVIIKYRKIHQGFFDLNGGLDKAQQFYSEMKDTVESLEKNVETFVNNRRSEGAQLLNQIERERNGGSGGQADRGRERLKELMERMSMDPSAASPAKSKMTSPRSQTSQHFQQPLNSYNTTSPPITPQYPAMNLTGRYQTTSPPPNSSQSYGYPQNGYPQAQPQNQTQEPYQQNLFFRPDSSYQTPISPPANQSRFSQQHSQSSQSPQYTYPSQQQSDPYSQQYQQHQQAQTQYMPAGYVPPPPPPGPPPLGPQQTFPHDDRPVPVGPDGYIQSPPSQQQHQQQQRGNQGQGDPWAGLGAWR
jgi:hypothetical protein